MTVRVILTDIEGTTTSIDFVHQVLFPYASKMLPEFVRRHQQDDEIADILQDARTAAGEPNASLDRLIETLLTWIEEDRKVTALKALQGQLWRHGYENGDFTAHVYEDAAACMRRWHADGISLYVYSSGSVAAQKLLFGHSDAGDLTPLFDGYFDTRIGHKREADSYRAIVAEIGAAAGDILFLSDVAEELDAAAIAGLQTVQLVRDEQVERGTHRIAHDFAEVELQEPG
jgi:enolase-phosphatase E1